MDKINPLLYITDTDPVPEVVLDASGWFETEYTEISSSPSDTSVDTEYLPWMLAQGWEIYDRDRGVTDHGTYITIIDTVKLRRRKLQSERALQDLITEFTDAYNEGREVNDRRYDEIVAIYNVMLDKTETELSAISTASGDYDDIIRQILGELEDDLDAHNTDVDALLDGYGDGLRAQINERFDNELTKARQSLIDRGMNNTTLWTTTSAGIERERSMALTDAEDKIIERLLASKDRLYVFLAEMRRGIMDGHLRLLNEAKDNAFKPVEFRNLVLQAMLNFMERREDEYPSLGDLSAITAQLGFSEGAATVAPSAS
jgi:hypothetical protein